jgi:hypothetical protein
VSSADDDPGDRTADGDAVVATLDDVTRFETAQDVPAYLGLTLGENSSPSRKQRTHVTKAGSPQMRWPLVQAAWTALRCVPKHPMAIWAVQVAERRGKRIAVVALARKLAGILFARWRDGTTYNPQPGGRLAKGIAQEPPVLITSTSCPETAIACAHGSQTPRLNSVPTIATRLTDFHNCAITSANKRILDGEICA